MARGSGPRSLLRPGPYLRATSINRGLFGDSLLWRAVFAVIFGRRLLRRLMGKVPETVAIEKLKPGQFVRIEAIDPETLERGGTGRPRQRGRRRRRAAA